MHVKLAIAILALIVCELDAASIPSPGTKTKPLLASGNYADPRLCSDPKDTSTTFPTWEVFCGSGIGTFCDDNSGASPAKCLCKDLTQVLENENTCRESFCRDPKESGKAAPTWADFCKSGTETVCDDNSGASPAKCLCKDLTQVLENENICRARLCSDPKDTSTTFPTWEVFCGSGIGTFCDDNSGASPAKCLCKDLTQVLENENTCRARFCRDPKESGKAAPTWADFCRSGTGTVCDDNSGASPAKCFCKDQTQILENENTCRAKCEAEHHPSGVMWRAFCDAGINAECSVVGENPVCVCKDAVNHKLVEDRVCKPKCETADHPNGMKWAAFCARGTNATCAVEGRRPACVCKDPVNDQLEADRFCKPKCEAEQHLGSATWRALCDAGTNTECAVVGGYPVCVCKDAVNHKLVEDKVCIPKTCSDTKDSSQSGMTWTQFCTSGDGAECDSASSPPKCKCSNKTHVLTGERLCKESTVTPSFKWNLLLQSKDLNLLLQTNDLNLNLQMNDLNLKLQSLKSKGISDFQAHKILGIQ